MNLNSMAHRSELPHSDAVATRSNERTRMFAAGQVMAAEVSKAESVSGLPKFGDRCPA
jgi:hypothetical protein